MAEEEWYASFPDRALPLVELGEGASSLKVNEETLALLSSITDPVCVVTVVGGHRTGKSSLLNWLCEDATGERSFGVGHGVRRCTRGIWVWGRPRRAVFADGTRGAVLLLDTEGLGGLNVDFEYDTRLFALGALLASTLCYNSLGCIDEHAISSLAFVSGIADHVRARPLTGDDALVSDAVRASTARHELSRYLPRFVWVLRDFALELADERGQRITPDEYLELSLAPRGKRASDATRDSFKAYFPRRGCATLPRPANSEKELQEGVRCRDARPELSAALQDLSALLFERCEPKRVDGCALRGATFAALARGYVDAFRKGDAMPTISSAWKSVVSSEIAEASALALGEHAAELSAANQRWARDAGQCDDAAFFAAHVNGSRTADDALRALCGGLAVHADLQAALQSTREECDSAFAKALERRRKACSLALQNRLARLSADSLTPTLERTREQRLDAELGPVVADAAAKCDAVRTKPYEGLEDAERRVAQILVHPKLLSLHASSLPRDAAKFPSFAVAACFDVARALQETRADRSDEAEELRHRELNTLRQRISYLEGEASAMTVSHDRERRRSHGGLQDTLLLKVQVDALEVALAAERRKLADSARLCSEVSTELADSAAALENEEHWQRELQERLDERIEMGDARESELAGELAVLRRTHRAAQRYTVLDFLLDDHAARKDDEQSELIAFLANFDVAKVLPKLRELGAMHVTDLQYLEPQDFDDLKLDPVSVRRLTEAIQNVKTRQNAKGPHPNCQIS